MKSELEKKILEIQNTLFSTQLPVVLTIPPEKKFGDFATNIAFLISKQLKTNPREIAEQIVTELQKTDLTEKIELAGPGFINIFINKKAFLLNVVKEIQTRQNSYLTLEYGKNSKLSIEHTAANPNKHLHIGHLRNFSIADSLVRIMRSGGYTVEVQYLLNDQGLQIAKVVWGFRNLEKLGLPDLEITKATEKFDKTAAKVYVAAEKVLSENVEYEKDARLLISQMEEGNNEVADYSYEITKNILLGQLKTTENFGVFYDRIITESTMTQSGEVERVINVLLSTGKVIKETEGKNAGCIVIKGLKDQNDNELADKVLIREDGTAVYTGKDIVVHLWKFGLLGVHFSFNKLYTQKNGKDVYITAPMNTGEFSLDEKSDLHINVVDQRQSFPLEIVKQSLKVLGFDEASNNFHHLAYETVVMSYETAKIFGYKGRDEVALKTVPMSGRKGLEVPVDDLLQKMTEFVFAQSKQKGSNISEQDARAIAASALRYYMLKFNYNTIIVFDISEALRSDGDSGIYLMYSYVRAGGILENNREVDYSSVEVPENIHSSALELMTAVATAQDVLLSVVQNHEVSKLTEYAYSLAKLFTGFYNTVSISKLENHSEKAFYCALVSSYMIVYKEVLELLGMTAPHKM